jgi:hypothetical protein
MAVTIALGMGVNYLIPHCDWVSFMAKVAIITVVYFGLIFVIGIKRSERKQVQSMILGKIHRSKR